MRPCGCNGDRGRHGRSCRAGLYKPPTRADRLLKSEAAGRRRSPRAPLVDPQPHCGVCPLPIMHMHPGGKIVWLG
jgi:hypothetical protein